jgi:valyl-tRNA synthetase
VSVELAKQYSPAENESELYKLWEESGAFKPNMDSDKTPFSIVMPPPNANGHIHVGTAMFVIEDIMTRYRRMQGHPTLWLPGTDHAGIETQVVFERELAKEGKSRFDYSPTEFYQAALDFTLSNQSTILSELKSMGFSADWSRLQFTLDEPIIDVVYETFKMLHDDGLLYRANRIVNWCTHCNSSFADIEVKHREQTDPLYYIKYGPFVLATVRPETKFGDTAIAVNPKDERYTKYVGTEIEAEGLNGTFKLKVIADDHVDPAFGTGVVKVTPAHDPNDWEMGLRHNLEVKQVIGTDGKLTEIAGRFAGMPVEEARVEVAREMEARGMMDHIEMDYVHSIAYHDRCGTTIEPLVTEQWWLDVKPLVKAAIAAVKEKEVTIVPDRFTGPYIKWLENLRDWNISRQNWFGISIPVFYNASDDTSKKDYIIATTEQEAIDYYGEGNYEKETDTFDTWFSSSQWPFATMMASGDFDSFYPTSVLETGRDILFIWVTRMLMFGVYRTGKVPFKTVYLHGLVNDAHGKKMSKSKGNVVNPLDMTSKYGTDALRLALTIGVTPGKDAALSEEKIQGYRNFCNKLWNVSRFILGQLPADYSPAPVEAKNLVDKWLLGKLAQTSQAVTKDIEEYRFSEAGAAVYSFVWNDFADWYIEASKGEANLDLLVHVLESVLKLIHPFAPFVSEAIWQKMPWQKQNLIISVWPEAETEYTQEVGEFEGLKELILSIRSAKTALAVGKVPAITTSQKLHEQSDLIKRLSQLESLEVVEQGSGLRVAHPEYDFYLDVDQESIQSYVSKLKEQQTEKQAYVKSIEKRLSNSSYVDNAPTEIVAESRTRLDEAKKVLLVLDEQIQAIDQS